MRLRYAALVAAVDFPASLTHAAVKLIRAVGTVDVPVAAPVVRNAALHVTLEPAVAHCRAVDRVSQNTILSPNMKKYCFFYIFSLRNLNRSEIQQLLGVGVGRRCKSRGGQ